MLTPHLVAYIALMAPSRKSVTPTEPQILVNLNEKSGLADAKVRIVIKTRSIFLEPMAERLANRLSLAINTRPTAN